MRDGAGYASTAAGGLRTSLTGELTSEAALLVGNLTNPAPRAGNGILRYHAGSGAFVDAIVPEGSGPARNPLLGPCCMVFGPDENLYVSNLLGAALTDRGVFRYNGVTGEFMNGFVAGNSGGLRRPLVLVFGPDGNLYVGDVGNVAQGGTAVRRYDGHTGAPLGVFVSTGAALRRAHRGFPWHVRADRDGWSFRSADHSVQREDRDLPSAAGQYRQVQDNLHRIPALYFASALRPGNVSGMFDLWVTTRSKLKGAD